jgi:hypothetical protein
VETQVEVRSAGAVPVSQVAAALALLETGRVTEARAALERALAEAGGRRSEAPAADAGFESLADTELERAFDAASADEEEMVDADAVALQAMRAADLDEPELPGAPFQTRTMAALLERQGDAEAARAIRSALDADAPAPDAQRAATIRVLEQWLARLRGGKA